ncbi:glycerophosphodiester phosphodiesterase [Exilibacterium tricleocarpae]|uniref:Glycerophosphodiester phosphodiesterase n=1 Tax=Exilibacterium tricleocarpae TaxID=2591008 RepID=A0A545TVP8_9GAMM|nr:glycerophosphodiester phosphodiesterase family protein [Exilibacterium tricleocarpae]TQV81300.1 glycerophosphodiester phosphodiesterase [Exilibacterium tricleocarpae]
MAISFGLDRAALALVDLWFALLPQPQPAAAKLRRCKLVSHRGQHDNIRVFENTLAAFDAVLARGVWGIECDVRWTRDLQPVVFHDPDGRRLFGSDQRIDGLTLAQLREAMPLIPTLADVVTRYGGRLHLMVEIKEETYPDPPHQTARLQEIFAPLVPERDYHFLSLNPALFRYLDFVSPRALLPVAELNLRRLSQEAIDSGFKGITGHFWLLSAAYLHRHRSAGQAVGTGFIRSRRALFREVNRDVDWVFTNHAVQLQAIIDRLSA